MTIFKPELLAPAGNVESFYAALNGGADAVFMGLPEFNARVRASNFTRPMLQLAIAKAHEKKVRVYITLNTLIKNNELDQLVDVLSFLDLIKADGIIIQDWGTFYLAKKYFPNLVLHASTQMANHNSAGVNFGESVGIVRTVLARELTMSELEKISQRTNSQLEIFIHGALCYSFSGMCLFSSYVGGQGANRGICKQSCRRIYHDSNTQFPIFSLKDNQQLDNLKKLLELGIHSLKIEGRMKSADYVFQVCKAYRLALENQANMNLASQMLEMDMGREKTSYFLGKDIADGIASDSSNGILVGKINAVNRKSITIKSSVPLEKGYRLRIRKQNEAEPLVLKIDDIRVQGDLYTIPCELYGKAEVNDEILVIRAKTQSFPSRIGNIQSLAPIKIKSFNKFEIRKGLKWQSKQPEKSRLIVRIGSPDWFAKLRFDDYDAIILSFRRSDWEKFNFQDPLLQQHRDKMRIELPKFISENRMDYYQNLALKAKGFGFGHFSISHLSQKLLLPKDVKISCNENVYVLNDAAARFVLEEKMLDFMYPLENDLENLLSMANKQGIVPLYFYPQLFYSRMPVGIQPGNKPFADENNKKYMLSIKDGISIVHPTIPVSLFQHRPKLEQSGFSSFLIDYSAEALTANVVKRIFKKYQDSEAVQPSTNFNFKLGLK